MPESNAIDNNTIASLKEIMGETFSMLINTFIDDTGKLIHSLETLQQQNNLEVFTRNVHSIKSSSANVGALQLSAIAADLESQGKTGDISSAGEKIDVLVLEFNKACTELKTIIP